MTFLILTLVLGTIFFGLNNGSTTKLTFRGYHDDLKPSIYFDDLELKCLCDNNELLIQFPKKLRSKWIKCLGLGHIYFPFGGKGKDSLDENTWKRLHLFMTSSDESLNVFCRLASNWKSCCYHLRSIHCIQSNPDTIQLAKDPKYSPLHHKQQAFKLNSKGNQISTEREDNIENMSELYRIRCEQVRMSSHYMSGGSADSTVNWMANKYGKYLFQDYQYPEENEDNLREEL